MNCPYHWPSSSRRPHRWSGKVPRESDTAVQLHSKRKCSLHWVLLQKHGDVAGEDSRIFLKLISYFIIFGWVFVAVTGLSLVAASRTTLPGCSEQASHCSGFSGCRAQTLESLGFNSCVAWVLLPWGMWSDPWSRDQTYVLCTGKWILNNWTTREVPIVFCFTLLKIFFYWSLFDWQCYAYFRGIAKWISYMYTYIHSFSDSFPLYVMLEHWVEFPVLLRRSLLVIYFIHRGQF